MGVGLPRIVRRRFLWGSTVAQRRKKASSKARSQSSRQRHETPRQLLERERALRKQALAREKEALDRQAATAEILKVISSSPADVLFSRLRFPAPMDSRPR